MKIIIRKDPDRSEHITNDIKSADYTSVINGVDLSDLTKFIKELNTYEWTKRSSWKGSDNFFIGELYWAIFAYLVDMEILLIEDRYFDYGTRIDRYISRDSYFNVLENDLYYPIVERLVENGFIVVVKPGTYLNSKKYQWCHFSISPAIFREEKLNELGI
jgi:hypothetical protein